MAEHDNRGPARQRFGALADDRVPTIGELLRRLDYLHTHHFAGGARAKALRARISGGGADGSPIPDPAPRIEARRAKEVEHYLQVVLLRECRRLAIEIFGPVWSGADNRDEQVRRIQQDYPAKTNKAPYGWSAAEIALAEGLEPFQVRSLRPDLVDERTVDELKAEARQLRESGRYSLREIALIVGVSHETVRKWLVAAQLEAS